MMKKMKNTKKKTKAHGFTRGAKALAPNHRSIGQNETTCRTFGLRRTRGRRSHSGTPSKGFSSNVAKSHPLGGSGGLVNLGLTPLMR